MENLLSFLMSHSGPVPYLLVLGILLACGIGLPIPEDITLFAAGLMSYYEAANVWAMIGISLFGVLSGDSFIYFLGAKYGPRLTERWFFRRILSPERLALVQEKLHTHGNKLIFAARFMPGLRSPVYFSSGMLHLPYRVFLFYDGMAALISVPTIIYSVFYFGDHLDRVIKIIQRIQYGIVFVIGGTALIFLVKWWFSHRKRIRIHAEPNGS